MRLSGLALVLMLLAVPLYWFAPLLGLHRPSAVLSQYLGATALIAMAMAQLLATRFRWLETVFGGLDRIYVLHKWLGIGALVAMLLHDSIGAEIKGLIPGTPFGDLGEDLGETAYNGFLVLVGVSLLTVIPYRWWAWTHKFIGLFFMLSVAHFILVAKPFALHEPVAIYILACCTIGVLAYIYNVLPFGRDARSFAYDVHAVERTGGALAVTLKPRRNGIRHRAGQFAFLRFEAPGLGEQHPFTISSAPRRDGTLRFTIKPLGDFTANVFERLGPGTGARVSGPFGRFIRHPGAKREVWIAAGIGVTPFVAWAESLEESGPPIHMIYCVRGEGDAPHLVTLHDIASRRANFTLQVLQTSLGQRLNPSQLADLDLGNLRSTHVSFCGPSSMRESVRAALLARGLRRRNFHFEEFELRTGVGLEYLMAWAMGRLRPKAA